MLLDHRLQLVRLEREDFSALESARARSVIGIVQKDAFADCFTGAQRHESHRASVHALLDRDRARRHDRHEAARRAFREQHRIGLEGGRFHDSGQLMQRRLGDVLEEVRLAKLIADCD